MTDSFERCIEQDGGNPHYGPALPDWLKQYATQTPITVGLGVVYTAYDVFLEAGCPADFCFQDISDDGQGISIFGSTNRLRFNPNPSHGPAWDYSQPHCTDKFIAHCESLGIPAR